MAHKILLVDDDVGIIEAVEMILENEGFEVKKLTESIKAEETMKDYRPDLIMLDLRMPKINGEELCIQLKKNDKYKDIPVIILSASNKTEEISKNCGADDFLPKPFDMDDLIAIVNKNLKKD